jgi:cation diffusion facilitator family transporter
MALQDEPAEPPLMTRHAEGRDDSNRVRVRTAVVAAVVGTILLGFKYSAYQLTGSTAILSDTLESIVNVIAALFALGGLAAAGWPVDGSHTYGHRRIDLFGAVFEGGMMALASALIIKEAGEALIFGRQLRQIDFGLLVTIGTGVANAVLGWYLVHTGRRHGSLSLIVGGTHALSDFWTSVATAVGLFLVRTTRLDWLDPVVAAMIGLNLLWSGSRLVRHAASGLLDDLDSGLLERLLQAMNAQAVPGVIRVHSLRTTRVGRDTLADACLVVPEFWTVEEAHEFATAFAHRVTGSARTTATQGATRISFQIEPCRRLFCASCEVEPCPIRVQPFAGRAWIKLEDAMDSGPVGQ